MLDITFAVIWERKYEDDQRNMKMDTRMSYKRQDYQATIRDVERKWMSILQQWQALAQDKTPQRSVKLLDPNRCLVRTKEQKKS